MKKELYNKLVETNAAYYNALNDIFKDPDLTVQQKAQIGTNAHSTFEAMDHLDKKCSKLYLGDK